MKVDDVSVQVSLKYPTRGVVNAGGVDSNSSLAVVTKKERKVYNKNKLVRKGYTRSTHA